MVTFSPRFSYSQHAGYKESFLPPPAHEHLYRNQEIKLKKSLFDEAEGQHRFPSNTRVVVVADSNPPFVSEKSVTCSEKSVTCSEKSVTCR